MLFDRYISREVDRRLHEQNIQREMWERMRKLEKQVEELQFNVKRLKSSVREGRDG